MAGFCDQEMTFHKVTYLEKVDLKDLEWQQMTLCKHVEMELRYRRRNANKWTANQRPLYNPASQIVT